MTNDADAVRARQLGLVGPRGPVFGPVNLDIATAQVTAVVAPARSGRTSLLLACTGRLAGTTGELSVFGMPVPGLRRRVQHASALANFHGVDSLDEGLRVSEVANERAGLLVPLWRRPSWFGSPAVDAVFRTVYGDDPAPEGDAQIWDLTPLDVARLRIALALLGGPRLVAVDDVDSVRDPDDQAAIWAALERVAAAGTTVVAATSSELALPETTHRITLETHA